MTPLLIEAARDAYREKLRAYPGGWRDEMTTLRGWENLNKRFKLAAAIYNLSQLMRRLYGFGTPKQMAAAMERGLGALFGRLALIFAATEFIMKQIAAIAPTTGRSDQRFFADGENIGV